MKKPVLMEHVEQKTLVKKRGLSRPKTTESQQIHFHKGIIRILSLVILLLDRFDTAYIFACVAYYTICNTMMQNSVGIVYSMRLYVS